jgi:hypothetical protein
MISTGIKTKQKFLCHFLGVSDKNCCWRAGAVENKAFY